MTTIKNAIITGATGYIGSKLVQLLCKKGVKVHAIVRTDPKSTDKLDGCDKHVYRGDTSEMVAILQSVQPDVVFHLASYSKLNHGSEDINPIIDANIKLGANLLEAMKLCGTSRIINAGSFWEHARSQKELEPICLYAAAKSAFQVILDYYCRWHGLSAATLKLYDVYGEDDFRKKLIPYLQDRLVKNEDIELTKGEQEIYPVHVDDVCAAFWQACEALEAGAHNCFFIGPKKGLKLRDFVELVHEKAGSKSKVFWGKRAYTANQIMKTESWPTLPGWYPKVSIEEGITRIVQRGK